MCELYVEKAWTAEFPPGSVRIFYSSFDDVFVRRMSRAEYRRGLEEGLRELNEVEARERSSVVQLRSRGQHASSA